MIFFPSLNHIWLNLWPQEAYINYLNALADLAEADKSGMTFLINDQLSEDNTYMDHQDPKVVEAALNKRLFHNKKIPIKYNKKQKALTKKIIKRWVVKKMPFWGFLIFKLR